MSRKMNAAVVEQFGRPLVLREMEIPTPKAGQILVKTEACGVCHTDLHAVNRQPLHRGERARSRLVLMV